MKYLILILTLLPSLLISQGWEKTYGIGYGRSVQQSTDGGYIIAGYKYVPESYNDVYLIKTDEFGDTLWTRTYDLLQLYDYGLSIQKTIDNGYIITGFAESKTEGKHAFLLKTDGYGDLQWARTYGGQYNDFGYAAQQVADEGFIVVGRTNSVGTGYDVFLIKTNSNGDTLWTKTYGGDTNDNGRDVQQTSDGGYIIVGYTQTVNMFSDIYVIKTDSIGDTLWTKTYRENNYNIGNSILQTTDNGYIIAGSVGSGEYETDVYLIKLDNLGDTLWTRKYDRSISDYGYSVQQTVDHGYIIVGDTRSTSSGKSDIYLIKTDNIGDTVWTRTFGGDYMDYGFSVQQTTDGGYIITGTSEDAAYTYVYLIKTDDNGNTVSTIEIPLTNPTRKIVKLVDLSGKEIIKTQKNIPFIEIYDDGTTQKKMIVK